MSHWVCRNDGFDTSGTPVTTPVCLAWSEAWLIEAPRDGGIRGIALAVARINAAERRYLAAPPERRHEAERLVWAQYPRLVETWYTRPIFYELLALASELC